MRVLGIDFTSRPGPRKPITCVTAELRGDELQVDTLERWPDFTPFEAALAQSGPWIAGLDFPFGMPARFIDNIGWPSTWAGYVQHVAGLSRADFRTQLDDYRQGRPPGDKEHRRWTDIAAGAISPQKLYGVPVGLMFFEGAPRLLASGAHVPGVQAGDPERTVVEAYPGALARFLIGRTGYKNDSRSKQTVAQHRARRLMFKKLTDGALLESHGIRVNADAAIASDPGADDLDALLCAVQAASAWLNREQQFGAPAGYSKDEGWIAEPTVYQSEWQ